MKKLILILTVATIATSCHTSQAALEERRADISWAAFCAARGYALDDNTYLTLNEYLDTWCGSAEEEQAFINAGVKPY